MNKKLISILLVVFVLTVGFQFDTKVSAKQSRDAEIRTSDISIPRTMKSGRTYRIKVRVRNTGDVRWSGRKYTLDSSIYRGPSGSRTQRDELTPDVILKGVVETGEYNTFYYEVTAPEYKGNYTLEWTMQYSSRNFGDRTRKSVRIIQ